MGQSALRVVVLPIQEGYQMPQEAVSHRRPGQPTLPVAPTVLLRAIVQHACEILERMRRLEGNAQLGLALVVAISERHDGRPGR